ncbi:hypothetical protein NPX13_g9982 [Xylaria arbuscula]|uniref:SMP-30/Gluconolactonase/LRE-like region domain-containing protein n=1 Tax=Xylaria arbuscula TaxID=114810 RepID=A0A9W8N5N1_9PEZI|nr:hypothetical protein NPX13_g9982 [Xylaria arbuscula]
MSGPLAAAHEPYSFPTEFIENVHVLPNGNQLLSTIKSAGLLYTIDLGTSVTKAKQFAHFDDTATGLTGIVPLSSYLYAVGGGLHTSFAFERGSVHVYIVSLETGTVVDSIPVPDTATLNGMAAIPRNPGVILGADSIDGRIFSINTLTKEVKEVLRDSALVPGEVKPGVPPIGNNGLRVRDNYVYFTNSALGTFSRFPIDEDGNKTGDFEVLARSPAPNHIYDDFAFDDNENAYVAVHPSSINKITPDGVRTTLSLDPSVALKEPTSVAVAPDGKSMYVVTGGLFYTNPRQGGQVVQIHL